MAHSGIYSYNKNRINIKTLNTTLNKALALDPDNEAARIILREVGLDLELIKLHQAIDKLKMNKACRIVLDSEYEEPYNAFFDFIKHNIKALSNSGMEKSETIHILNDMYDWCLTVDSYHPVLDDLSEELDLLGTERK